MNTAWPTSHSEKLSADLLKCIKASEENCTPLISKISKLKVTTLESELKTSHERLAFWLNLYNGLTQNALKEDVKSYEGRSSFFSRTVITIDDHELSLDDIEHGLIRSSKWKYGLGLIGKIFVSDFEEKLRLPDVDWRIHFALNCGAESCPPIYFYRSEILNRQLDLATSGFLENDIVYVPEKNMVKMSALFSWFRGDFGKRKGILKILKDRGLIPADADPKFHYKKYDWSLSLKNYDSSE